MSKGFRLLRVEYIFSVLVPCLLCIYFNNYHPTTHIWIMAGFAFYAITGNTLNDAIDMKDPSEKETLERVKGYQRKEILVLSIASFVLGTLCFWNVFIENLLLLIYLLFIVSLVIFYCKFKSLIVVNQIILGVSHIFLPWFMIKINAGAIILNFLPDLSLFEWLVLSAVASVAFTGQMLHELIDGDSLSKLSPKKAQIVIIIGSIVSLVIGVSSIIITQDLLFFPIVIFPIGIMYIFRKPRTNLLGRKSLKDTGIILGNLIFIYIIILLIAP
ncbi:MAG: hypothetical protein EU517_00030 [Promethearchaeota archaeon]|nr:MAG: hypothetical protein EU517_00030 [Candidatus Lokiarchaeota archaeon]